MRLVLIVVITLLCSPAIAGNVFACKDARGSTTFQQTPCATAAQQKQYTYQPEPDAPIRVETEAQFVQRNRQSAPHGARAQPKDDDDATCMRDRFTPRGECLDWMGERADAKRRQAEADRLADRSNPRVATTHASDQQPFDPSAQVRDSTGQVNSTAIQVGPGVVWDYKTGAYHIGATQNADGSVTTQPK